MYLKEICSTGFKSFADKFTISLDDKTTCIVGPNGSGKSNIVDAVRWVLGEQSVKSLRGNDTMTDVIFSGSKSRSPLNVASVSLIFDNTDGFLSIPYSEVSIKRRVYRSGENEYFLNGEKCRLKDITELLIDSAVGKESFNIISQGEIQKILSNSSYERRSIFESASGVLKYKKRKEEAIRKLDRTNSNLDRVLDIINELEMQVEPLKEQSIKAQEYLDTKAKLQDIEIAYIVSEIERLNYDYGKYKQKLEVINSEILNLNVKSSGSDTTIISEKNKLVSLNSRVKDLNQSLLDLTRLEEKLNGEKKLLSERSKYSSDDAKVHESIQRLKEEILHNKNSRDLINKDLEILINDKNNLNNDLVKVESELNNLRSKKSSTLIQEGNIKKELLGYEQKAEVLTNFIENYGSVNSSVKAVLSNPRLKGIYDILGNIVDTKDIYIKALEVAIQSTKQFIVVDSDISAKSAISYLKDNNLGRATFFPINVIKPKGIEPDVIKTVEKDPGYVGIFIDLVSYDDKYYNIISNQLGNVIVASDFDSANRISKSIYQRYKVVTIEGDVVHVGGSITGGSVKVQKSIITEKKELENYLKRSEELKIEVSSVEEELKVINSSILSIEEEINKISISIINNNEIIKTKNELIQTVISKINELESDLNAFNLVTISSLSEEEEKVTNSYYETLKKKELLIKEIDVLVKESEILNNRIEEMDAANRVDNSMLSRKEKELRDIEVLSSKVEFKLDNYLNTLSLEYELTFDKAKANYELQVESNEALNLINSYKNIIKNIGMVNINSIEDYKRVSERYEFLTSQRNDLLNAKETLINIISEMDEVMKVEFLSTFEKVKIEFRKVFKELFNGGSADLELTNPNDLLETGIDIVASPPGKTLKSITLLSGGEMTLTAISLIFAILNIKTVPFCIFDEVEAALDEANVDNFGKYLNHYKDKTQFLIITHKKKTMEYADTLYGITMQESGVSKLVSVKLDKIGA